MGLIFFQLYPIWVLQLQRSGDPQRTGWSDGNNYFVSHFYQFHFTEMSVNTSYFPIFLFLSVKHTLWNREMK